MNQGGHNRFSECGWFVCFSADSGTQVILDNPVILSKNLYTYDRLGRQLSAIADGVSTNLYAYSRYGQLTNEVVQGLCCASAGDNLPRHRRPRPQHRLLAFPSTSGRGPGCGCEAQRFDLACGSTSVRPPSRKVVSASSMALKPSWLRAFV